MNNRRYRRNPATLKQLGASFIFMAVMTLIFTAIEIIPVYINRNTYKEQIEAQNVSVILREGYKEDIYVLQYYYEIDNEIYICESTDQIDYDSYQTKKTVYYETDNPKNCIIETKLEIEWHLNFLGLFGLFILGTGIYMINAKKEKTI